VLPWLRPDPAAFPCISLRNEIALPTRPPSRRGQRGFLRDREIYPDACRKCWHGDRRVAGAGHCRSAPGHRSESPTGYSSAGCSPAEPASASPVANTNNPSSFRRSIKCAARPQARAQTSRGLMASEPTSGQCRCNRLRDTRVSFLLCTPGDISILRRHDGEAQRPRGHNI
jgi:hypothetical protein